MAVMKWKDAEITLRAEGLRFGFAQLMAAVQDGKVKCTKTSDGLMLDIDDARAWAIAHNAPKRKAQKNQPDLFDNTEQLRRIAETLERIEALLKT